MLPLFLPLWRLGGGVLAALALAGCGGGGATSEPAPPLPAGQVYRTLDIPHGDVVYDPFRSVYLVSAFGSAAPELGNRIVSIDRDGRVVATSPVIGVRPGALALSADGSHLYLGLEASGEVVKLRLPSFEVVWRAPLPIDPVHREQTFAEDIEPVPTEADAVVVSLALRNTSPRHRGLVLIRDGVTSPLFDPLYSANRMAFAGGGSRLLTIDSDTSSSSFVQRFGIGSGGLTTDGVFEITGGRGRASIAVVGDRVFVGGQVLDASTLATVGAIAGAEYSCVGVGTVSRLACLTPNLGELIVADLSSLLRVTLLEWPEVASAPSFRLVAGPPGQVAATSEEKLYLLGTDLLR